MLRRLYLGIIGKETALSAIDTPSDSNYIVILELTPGFNWMGKDNCKTRQKKN